MFCLDSKRLRISNRELKRNSASPRPQGRLCGICISNRELKLAESHYTPDFCLSSISNRELKQQSEQQPESNSEQRGHLKQRIETSTSKPVTLNSLSRVHLKQRIETSKPLNATRICPHHLRVSNRELKPLNVAQRVVSMY